MSYHLGTVKKCLIKSELLCTALWLSLFSKSNQIVNLLLVRIHHARSAVTQDEWLMLKECNGYTRNVMDVQGAKDDINGANVKGCSGHWPECRANRLQGLRGGKDRVLQEGETGMLSKCRECAVRISFRRRCEKRRQVNLPPFFFLFFLLDSGPILYPIDFKMQEGGKREQPTHLQLEGWRVYTKSDPILI